MNVFTDFHNSFTVVCSPAEIYITAQALVLNVERHTG